MAFSLIYPQGTQAGEIYTYTDKDGRTIVTNMQIPDEYKAKAKKIDSYREPSPSETNEQDVDSLSKLYRTISGLTGNDERAGMKKHAMNQAVELHKAQLRKQRSTPSGNQQDEMEDEMKRQQREMKAKTEAPLLPKGAINIRTGEYYPPGAGGIIEPKTGTFLPDVGAGYVDPRTGKFIPKIGH